MKGLTFTSLTVPAVAELMYFNIPIHTHSHPYTYSLKELKTHTDVVGVCLKAGAGTNFQGQQDYQCVFWKMPANQLSS